MNLRIKVTLYLLLSSFLLSGSSFAATHGHKNKPKLDSKKPPNHFEIIGALGAAKLYSRNSELGVTSSETDKLVQTNKNNWHTFASQLGLGYVYYSKHAKEYSPTMEYPNRIQWFTAIEPGVNVYNLNSNNGIKGNVWRFNSSNFNDLTYKIPVRSTRLMLDLSVTVATWKRLSLYGIGGIGNAWNRISYSDTNNSSNAPCPDQTLNLHAKSSAHFAWEAGLGLIFNFNDRIGVSAEYLYASLGRVTTSATGTTGTITAPIIVPAHFNLNAQTALLGLHIAL